MSGAGNKRPEPVQVIKQRRDAALKALVDGIPYIRFLGIQFERRGDELTAVLPFKDELIGNPLLPALHGGVTSGFLETTAIVGLGWSMIWDEIENGDNDPADLVRQAQPKWPKTIDLTVDYLRSGLPRDAYARAEITRSGRRYASVRVEAWQDNRDRPFAQATGHFLMPERSSG
jgi:acyl-coenzyme A thioesterase PaaI-like protein